MKKLRIFLFALSLASILEALPREAFGDDGLSRLDQQQLHSNGHFAYNPELVVWQSFTPGITGVLTEIDMAFLYEIHSSGRLRVLAGEGLEGEELQSLTVRVDSDIIFGVSWNAWTVNVPVQAGLRYTFSFRADAAGWDDSWGVIIPRSRGSRLQYRQGVMGIEKPSDPLDAPLLDVSDDLVFRTFVSERPTRKPLPGTVISWGNNDVRQNPPPTRLSGVVAVTGGEWHSLALRMDGTVAGWDGASRILSKGRRRRA
jgi:hypothetical protein